MIALLLATASLLSMIIVEISMMNMMMFMVIMNKLLFIINIFCLAQRRCLSMLAKLMMLKIFAILHSALENCHPAAGTPPRQQWPTTNSELNTSFLDFPGLKNQLNCTRA